MHPHSNPLAIRQTGVLQVTEVPRYLRLWLLQYVHQVTDTELPLCEKADDSKPGFITQGLEQLNPFFHTVSFISYIRIYAYKYLIRAVIVKNNRVISKFTEVICRVSAPVLVISSGSLSVWTFYAFTVNINTGLHPGTTGVAPYVMHEWGEIPRPEPGQAGQTLATKGRTTKYCVRRYEEC
jgi:hypothetical protein